MSPRNRSPVKTLSPRRPSGQDHGNQMSPLHNLTLLQPRIKLLVSSGQRRTGPRLSLVSPKVFSSILSPMEFWFLAAVASGSLSWGHFISSDIIDLIAQILFKLNWAGRWHLWIQWWTAFNWKFSVYYCPFAFLTHYFPIWYCKATLTQSVLLKALYK